MILQTVPESLQEIRPKILKLLESSENGISLSYIAEKIGHDLSITRRAFQSMTTDYPVWEDDHGQMVGILKPRFARSYYRIVRQLMAAV